MEQAHKSQTIENRNSLSLKGIEQFKVIYLGDSCAGKTSLFLRTTGTYWQEKVEPTINADLARTLVTLPYCQVSLQLWDTPG